jgi:transketolase
MIFDRMNEEGIFILSSGHAALALYAVLQERKGLDADDLYQHNGCHPHLDDENGMHCSTGSLGMGLTVAVGRALANPRREVHCLISDGECSEGSIWEALAFIESRNLRNLHVYVNMNGYSAYDSVDVVYLENRLKAFLPRVEIVHTSVERFPFLKGINAHYHIMSKEDYECLEES